jgi:DNA-binding MarR family transcriptional regulator
MGNGMLQTEPIGGLSQQERQTLERLLSSLDEVLAQKAKMPLTMLAALLRVAVNEAKSAQDLTRDAGVAQSIMSRDLFDLGPLGRNGNSLGLVEHRPSSTNPKVHEFYLSHKGVALVRNMAAKLVTVI